MSVDQSKEYTNDNLEEESLVRKHGSSGTDEADKILGVVISGDTFLCHMKV